MWASTPLLGSLAEPLLSSATVTAKLPRQTSLQIDPRLIARRLIKDEGARSKRFFWDGRACGTEPFRESSQYRLIEDIWRYRDRLEDSPTWARLNERISEGKAFTRRGGRRFALDTSEKVRDFLYGYRAIMEDMRSNGYRPEKDRDEIGVAIDADGGFLKVSSGKHRTAMAQVLGVPKVPVRVLFVHRTWWHRCYGQVGGAPIAALAQGLAALEKQIPGSVINTTEPTV